MLAVRGSARRPGGWPGPGPEVLSRVRHRVPRERPQVREPGLDERGQLALSRGPASPGVDADVHPAPALMDVAVKEPAALVGRAVRQATTRFARVALVGEVVEQDVAAGQPDLDGASTTSKPAASYSLRHFPAPFLCPLQQRSWLPGTRNFRPGSRLTKRSVSEIRPSTRSPSTQTSTSGQGSLGGYETRTPTPFGGSRMCRGRSR